MNATSTIGSRNPLYLKGASVPLPFKRGFSTVPPTRTSLFIRPCTPLTTGRCFLSNSYMFIFSDAIFRSSMDSEKGLPAGEGMILPVRRCFPLRKSTFTLLILISFGSPLRLPVAPSAENSFHLRPSDEMSAFHLMPLPSSPTLISPEHGPSISCSMPKSPLRAEMSTLLTLPSNSHLTGEDPLDALYGRSTLPLRSALPPAISASIFLKSSLFDECAISV